ncbi:MAG TPA: D-inositol-3-phosphate glycosyltransferase [Actinomycetes bacterium]|nr:D-inositol-3-phosphate glycosyltransferase [Actinomycetes bacterium]
MSVLRRLLPRRVAVLSVHTSPLDQPGTGDAGGMNVYIVETARRLANLGVEIEIFTRATSGDHAPVEELAPGVLVRHLPAGPFEPMAKENLPGLLCSFSTGLLRIEAQHDPGYFDLVHSHYWLSGQVGTLAQDRWRVPLVHSMHTMAKVKNRWLAEGDTPEPSARVVGETQVVEAADRLVANTSAEARQLIDLYDADPETVAVVPPGVDLDVFTPGVQQESRRHLGVADDAAMLLFVGRIQPLKAPDVLLHAAAEMLGTTPELRDRLVVAVVGGPSGSGLAHPEHLEKLASSLGIGDVVRFAPPADQRTLAEWYRAADVTVVPSYNESFGLVAVESQACGTPVVAAAVGGLRTAVADGVSGELIDGHNPRDYARVLTRLLEQRPQRLSLAAGALTHARQFGWETTAQRTLDVYGAAIAQTQATDDTVAS